MPIDLIFWDWNGTLLDDVADCCRCLNTMLSQNGYPQQYNLAEYREVFGFPIRDYYLRAGFDLERQDFAVLAEQYMELYNACVPACGLTAHAEEVLRTFRQEGRRQVILSASRLDYLIEQVEQRCPEGCFEKLLGLSDIYAASKVQIGLDWMRQAGVDPARCVLVGDSQHDAEVAAALGVRCVLFTGGHQSRPRLEACTPYVIDDLRQLPALLDGGL